MIPLRLSQQQLETLTTCPRKFQHTYLDGLAALLDGDRHQQQEWGDRFHLLMQQREWGLPIESLGAEHPQMLACVEALIQAAPEVFFTEPQAFRQAEHPRMVQVAGYPLLVVYDLLLATPTEARILDWKTYPRPQRPDRLKQRWQTRLYLFVLAETTAYLPEQISMTYWFVRPDDRGQIQPQQVTFAYTSAWHEDTRQTLTRLLQQLSDWLEQYPETPLPQVGVEEGHCQRCPFDLRCDRALDIGSSAIAPMLVNLEEIEEVAI